MVRKFYRFCEACMGLGRVELPPCRGRLVRCEECKGAGGFTVEVEEAKIAA